MLTLSRKVDECKPLVVERLLAAPGVNIEKGWAGRTPLFWALKNGHADVAQKLRAAGATKLHDEP